MKTKLQRGIASPYVNHSCDAQAMNDTKEAPATHQTHPEIYLKNEIVNINVTHNKQVIFISYYFKIAEDDFIGLLKRRVNDFVTTWV